MPHREIKKIRNHFRIFTLYFEYDHDQCKKEMVSYFKQEEENKHETEKAVEKRVLSWWNEDTKPQSKYHGSINAFFKVLSSTCGKDWSDQWIVTPLDDLEKNDPLLTDAILKFHHPNAISRFHKTQYGDPEALNYAGFKKIADRYCHQCFYIYRLHTTDRHLVRDMLRIRGHIKENIFCNMYQYTPHDIKSPKNKNWNNIKRFNGNLFFNDTSLNIAFVAPDIEQSLGLEYAHIMSEKIRTRSEFWGILLGLKDDDLSPVADTILIREAKDIPHPFNLDQMNEHVKKLDGGTYQEKEEYADIRRRIEQRRGGGSQVTSINK